MKVALVLGTRPEIIKMSPIVRALEQQRVDFYILHTGQHYSSYMDDVFFHQLTLPEAKYHLEVGSGTHAEQTGKMLIGIETVLQGENPDVVLVEGDTNTVLAGALAATKLGIHVGHVEAGLRSYDRQMPEEINRIVADHCSDLLFAPTQTSYQILRNEGIAIEKIFVTGNTIVDAIYQNLEIAERTVNVLQKFGLQKQKYFVVTIHRQENVDNAERFRSILTGLKMVKDKFGLEMLYPIHPRAAKQMETSHIHRSGLRLIEPLDYFTFLQLENNATLTLTDSGGVQEEACILKVPCVTLRYNTERPETLDVGSNILAGTDPYEIVKQTEHMLSKRREWLNPFGDGTAGQQIVDVLVNTFSSPK